MLKQEDLQPEQQVSFANYSAEPEQVVNIDVKRQEPGWGLGSVARAFGMGGGQVKMQQGSKRINYIADAKKNIQKAAKKRDAQDEKKMKARINSYVKPKGMLKALGLPNLGRGGKMLTKDDYEAGNMYEPQTADYYADSTYAPGGLSLPDYQGAIKFDTAGSTYDDNFDEYSAAWVAAKKAVPNLMKFMRDKRQFMTRLRQLNVPKLAKTYLIRMFSTFINDLPAVATTSAMPKAADPAQVQKQMESIQKLVDGDKGTFADLLKDIQKGETLRDATFTQINSGLDTIKNAFALPNAPVNLNERKAEGIRLPLNSSSLQSYRSNIARNTQFGFKQGTGVVSAFPQWIGSQAKAYQKQVRNLDQIQASTKRLTNPNDPVLSGLASLSQKLVSWDAASNKWVGPSAQKGFQKAVARANNINEKFTNNNRLIKTVIPPATIALQIPKVIQDITDANAQLSKVGFGPLVPGGVPLYAGRWLDTATGNIRQLPEASDKYLNPLSKQQRLAYLQAKMLNHWNQIVRTYQQHRKTSVAINYEQSAIKKIQNMLNVPQNTGTFNKKITSTIQWYFGAKPDPKNVKYLLLTQVGKAKLATIYAMKNTMPGDKKGQLVGDQLDENNSRIAKWTTDIKAAGKTLTQNASKTMSQGEFLKFQVRVNRLVLALTSFVKKSLQKGVLQLFKANVVPRNADPAQMVSIAEAIDARKEALQIQTRALGKSRLNEDYQTTQTLIDALKQGREPKNMEQANRNLNSLQSALPQLGRAFGLNVRPSGIALAEPSARKLTQQIEGLGRLMGVAGKKSAWEDEYSKYLQKA